MSTTNLTLLFAIISLLLLTIDGVIELGFITATVRWLHDTAGGAFAVVRPDGTTFNLDGTPLHMLVDQGHTANGAAGTAVVLIGIGGLVALLLRPKPLAGPKPRRLGEIVYYIWLLCNLLALALTFAALVYVMSVTQSRKGEDIDLNYVTQDERYPLLTWTPQNWFEAMLRLDLADAAQRADIQRHFDIMRGWQWNLIPLLVLQLVEVTAVFLDFVAWSNAMRRVATRSGKEHETNGAHL